MPACRKAYDFQPMPTIFFGHQKPFAYVLNPRVGSTLTLNFIFYVNHGYRYFNPYKIYHAPTAMLGVTGPELNPEYLRLYLRLKPETFSIVRDPLKRFVSAFVSKIFIDGDPIFFELRDSLTSLHGIDLSDEADPAQSCLTFAKWIATREDPQLIDSHFRPQHLNLAMGSRFTVDTIIRLEDRDALLAYYAKWAGEEKAKWFLNFRFNDQIELLRNFRSNEQAKLEPDDFLSDELAALVRQIYAKDYELFYG
jgi:Sulfotransferase family